MAERLARQRAPTRDRRRRTDTPERKLGAVVSRKRLERRLQKGRLRNGAFGDEPFDIAFECRQRRSGWRCRGSARIGSQAARKTRKAGKEIRHRRLIRDVRLQAADVDADRVRVNSQHVAVERKLADDHLGRADEMADLDHRRVAQRRGQREVQFLERTHPFVARNRGDASSAQLILQQYGGGFAEPLHAAARVACSRRARQARGRRRALRRITV